MRNRLFHTLEAQIFGMLQKDGALSFSDVDTSLEKYDYPPSHHSLS